MANVSIVPEEYLGFPHCTDYNFRTVFKVQTVLVLTVVQIRANTLFPRKKKIVRLWKLWKIWKENAFIELCSFSIDLLAFELGKLCPGVGISVSFVRPGGRSFALKSCPGGRDFDGKN